MTKRTLCIQSKVYLHISHGLIAVNKDQHETTLPLEELGVVILDTNQSTVTTACLSALAGSGTEVLICGPDHMPCGILQPLATHCREARIIEEQLAMSKPLSKQLWSRIVQAKILNQAAVLKLMGLPSDKLVAWSREVCSGDSTNREGVAAREYFDLLFPEGGRRSSCYTAALDYGYAIVRASIARACAAGGWLVSRGLHHHSLYNSFNLADDLIEPFRPLVDLLVLANDIKSPLAPEEKALLTSVLEYTMSIDNKTCSCQQCIDLVLRSLRTSIADKNPSKLLLPKLEALSTIPLE